MIKKLYLTIAAITLLAVAGFAEEPVITMTTTTKGYPFSFYLRGTAGSSITVDFGVGTPVTQTLTGESSYVTFTSTANLTADATEIKLFGNGITNVLVYKHSLTVLDVSRCGSLKYLSCSANNLTSLDVSKNLALTYLDCWENRITSLDVSQNVALRELYCYDNELSSLKINSNAAFSSINCSNNQLDITSLPIPNSKISQYTYSPQRAVTLPKAKIAVGESIDLSRYTSVVDASGSAKPTVFTWKAVTGESLVAGTDYTVSGGVFTFTRNIGDYVFCELANPVFSAFIEEHELKTHVVLVGDAIQPLAATLTTNEGYGNAYSLYLKGYAGVSIIVDFGDGGAVTKNLEGEDREVTFTSPKNMPYGTVAIKVLGNGITGIRLDRFFYISSIKPEFTLDVSQISSLSELDCGQVALRTLDLSKNANLVILFCNSNDLSSLDLSKNLKLKYLNCTYNELTMLDISKNIALKDVFCNKNSLSTLKLNSSAKFNYFDCSQNRLDYTTLPLPSMAVSYTYEPQYSIPQQKQIIALGETVDLSRFLTVKDASNVEHSTTFAWKKHTGELLVEGTDYTRSGGVFTLKQEGLAYCELSNAVFPNFAGEKTLKTANVLVGEQPFAFSLTTINKGSFSFSLGGAIGSPITVKYSNGITWTKSIEEFDGTFTCPSALTADATDVTVYGCGIKTIYFDYFQGLSSIDVSQLASLEEFYCAYNNLTTLDVSNNLALKDLTCYKNQLNSISLNHNSMFERLSIELNSLSFATLPQMKKEWQSISYFGQRALKLPKASYAVGEAIDLSSQLSAKDVDGNVQTTIYSWYNSKNEMLSPINDYTESNGVFTFKRAIADNVYCHMSNRAYPDFDKSIYDWFRTESIKINSPNGIEEGIADGEKVYVSNGIVVVEGLRGGEAISVVNMLGSVVHQSVAGSSSVTIPLPVHGLYVVRVGTSAHRIAW